MKYLLLFNLSCHNIRQGFRYTHQFAKNIFLVVRSHESPQSMIQPAEDFLILPMKKPCIQGDCGTPGVRIIPGVPLFSFCGGGAPSGKIWNLNPLLAPQERKLRGIGKIKTWHLELPWERWPASYT